MIERADAHELIAGMTVDAQFGPVFLFGHGGTAVEAIDDKALALPPLNLRLAHELLSQTRVFRLLRGFRDHPPAGLDAIALTLVKLSQMVSDLDEIMEIDLNPILADAKGVIAVDARVRVAPNQGKGRATRLAIQPYPKELERDEYVPAVGAMKLRPIRPEDGNRIAQFVAGLTPEDARPRFFSAIRSLAPATLARLTQIDYDREMAFVLDKPEAPDRFLAVVRLAGDPDNYSAEFAIIVRSDLHRRGLGQLLMARLIEYARNRGLSVLVGDVLAENMPMRALCTKLGFTTHWGQAADTIRVELRLTPEG